MSVNRIATVRLHHCVVLGILGLAAAAGQMEGCVPQIENCPEGLIGCPDSAEITVDLSEQRIAFDATGSCDPDGDPIIAFRWTPDADCPFGDREDLDALGARVQFPLLSGCKRCTVDLTVVDARGGVDTCTIAVEVEAFPKPALRCEPALAIPGERVCCDASASVDADDDPATAIRFNWAPPEGVIAPLLSTSSTFCFDAPGPAGRELLMELTVVGTCLDTARPVPAPPQTVRVVECKSDDDCEDDVDCTVDRCNLQTNACEHIADDAFCDDTVDCTLDICDVADGCVNQPEDAACDDGSLCTTDMCDQQAGCIHSPVSCDDENACTADSCDPDVGCIHTAISCDDGNACTADSCDPATGCVHTGITCNDGNACTADSCDPATGCVHTGITCNDGNACTSDSCDPAVGCLHTDVTCDDGNACTADSCDPAIGCVNADISATCDDGDVCTADSCDPAVGCVNQDLDCQACCFGDGICEDLPPSECIAMEGSPRPDQSCAEPDVCVSEPVQQPDLLPLPDESGSFCNRGEFGLIVTIGNQGQAESGSSTTTVTFTTINGDVGTDVDTPPVPAGGSVEITVPIPGGCFNPDCLFEIVVDSNGEIAESDEDNNLAGGSCQG